MSTTQSTFWNTQCESAGCTRQAAYAVKVHVVNDCIDRGNRELDVFGNMVYFLCHPCAANTEAAMARIVCAMVAQVGVNEYPMCGTCHGLVRCTSDVFRMEPILATAP